MLHRGTLKRAADLINPQSALPPVFVEYADFDEFVALERKIDFSHDLSGETGFTDNHHRMQAMSACAQAATRCGR